MMITSYHSLNIMTRLQREVVKYKNEQMYKFYSDEKLFLIYDKMCLLHNRKSLNKMKFTEETQKKRTALMIMLFSGIIYYLINQVK